MVGKPPLVLCVDDDLRMLEILSKILSRLPIEYLVTASPLEAVEVACRERPSLLILDLMLPGMSGWEVLDKIRSEAGPVDMRVLVLTAKDGGYERLVAANVARVDLYLTKPFDPRELAWHILRLLNLETSPPDGDALQPGARGEAHD